MILNCTPREVFSKEDADRLRKETGAEIVDVENLMDHEDILSQVEIIIPPWKLKKEDLDKMTNLKWIQTFSAGVNTLPLEAIKERGILLTNSSGVHGPQMSEHILGMMLAFSRGILESIKNQRTKTWTEIPGLTELTGKEMLIVGAGSIGTDLAVRAKAFGMRVVGLKRTYEALPNFDEVRTMDSLLTSMETADYVVILAPLTKDTRGLIGRDALSRMKKDAVLINLGRGPLVDEEALISMLKEKKIRGAGLDVFHKEPLPEDSPLWTLDNVIITPHIGGLSDVAVERSISLISENMRRYKSGEKLLNLVDMDWGY